MNVKVAVLLALAFFASVSLIVTVPSAYADEPNNISNSFVECDDPAPQPLGDPIGGGGVPH